MTVFVFAVLGIILFNSLEMTYADVCKKGSEVVSRKFSDLVRDHRITGPILSTVNVESERECELACHLAVPDKCGIINYDTSTKTCELLYKDRSAEYRVEKRKGSSFSTHQCHSNLCGRVNDTGQCFMDYCIVLRSCSHAKSLGYNESRNYTISPGASGKVGTFQVFCDMRDKNGIGVTVVSHDSEDRIPVLPKCEPAGCYRRDVNYDGISDVDAQLGALANVSTNCEQYIQYECYASSISNYAWLESRDGRRMDYWGGTSPGSQMCACGMVKGCKARHTKCNCDSNAEQWLTDAGLLTYKDDLPISTLRFGDTSFSHEEGFHTLGKLKCYGQSQP